MSNSFYNHSVYPTPNSPGSSAQMRAELQLISNAFDKMPGLAGAANRPVVVNGAGTALVTTTSLAGLDITGGTINNTPIGSVTPAPGAFTTLAVAAAAALGSNVTIDGGVINGTAIGGVTPAAGAFTTLAATSITGNLFGNVTGNLTGNVAGNVTGNLTGNVTSAGTSTFNNVTISGTLNMDAGTTSTIENLATPVNPGDAATKSYVDTRDALKLDLTGGTMSGAIAMGGSRVTGLADPVNPQDAATKVYVDNVVQGLDAKDSCRVATTANIALSGTQTIDGVAVVAGERVLVKDQSAPAENGIYIVAAGAWTRAPDANTWVELTNAFTFVERGTANGQNGYVCNIIAGGTLGTTAVTWVQFSGAGQVVAGAGMSKVGNTLNVGTASSTRIVVNSDDIDLAASGITAGTYRSVTVDQYGRATSGTNPTTVAGYGITDTYTKTQEDALLAQKLPLAGGTMTGQIAMGSQKITGLANPTNAQDAVTLNYVTTLYGSTVSAATSASQAAASAINAAASETNADTYAGQALTSANNAAASYDAFDDRYLGAKASDPSVDNDGNALLVGALYWNSSAKVLKVFDGAGWLAAYLPATGYLPVSGGTMTGNIAFAGTQTWPTFNQSTTGNAATATKLETARTINGVSFDGTANITVTDDTKQATLVSGTNIKTINGESLLGAGNINIVGAKPSLQGDPSPYVTQTKTYQITNYNSFSTYSVAASAGTASISGDTITFTAPSTAGSVNLTLTVDSQATVFVITVQAAGVAKPTNTSPADGATGVTESPTLQSSAFVAFGLTDTHLASRWTVYQGGTQIHSSGWRTDALTSYTVPGGVMAVSTAYTWTVEHRGNALGDSPASTATSFTTAATFNSYIATPTATPANFGDALDGGFYAGMVWEQLTQSSTSMAIATGSKTFAVPSMTSAPIVYGGQTVEVRSRANPANKMVGTVTNAAGTSLTINVTSVGGSGTFSDWSVMARHRIIVAPKASGEHAGIALKNANTAFPTVCQTLTEGLAATQAMRDADTSTVYPAAHWARNLNIGGRTDWYIPARDELELCWRNLKPVTDNNYTAADRPTAASFNYANNGSYGDTANTHGTNNNSSPTGAAYTTTVPGQTAATAFRTGGAEAYEFGSAYYWSSSDYNASFAWCQYWYSSNPGFQYNDFKTYAYRVRAVRRSVI